MPPHIVGFEPETVASRSSDGRNAVLMDEEVASTSSCPTPNKRSRRSVDFSETPQVYDHDHFRDYTPEELHASWITKEEMRDLRADCIRKVQILDQHQAARTTTTATTTSSSIADMRTGIRAAHRSFSAPSLLELDTEDVRGLQSYTQSALIRSKRARLSAKEAVFGMQRFQRFQGMARPELVADVYRKSSAACQELAVSIASEDAKEASWLL